MAAATTAPTDLRDWIGCHECDLLQRKRPLSPGERASCSRCGCSLYEEKRNGLDRALALTLASLVLIVLANVFPFMIFSLDGRVQESTLF